MWNYTVKKVARHDGIWINISLVDLVASGALITVRKNAIKPMDNKIKEIFLDE